MINTKDLSIYLTDVDDFIEDKEYRYYLYPKSKYSLGIIQNSNNLILKAGLKKYVSRVIHFGNEYFTIKSRSGLDKYIISEINNIFIKYVEMDGDYDEINILSRLQKYEEKILNELKRIKK